MTRFLFQATVALALLGWVAAAPLRLVALTDKLSDLDDMQLSPSEAALELTGFTTDEYNETSEAIVEEEQCEVITIIKHGSDVPAIVEMTGTEDEFAEFYEPEIEVQQLCRR